MKTEAEVLSMLDVAKLIQQDLYESLPGYTKYKNTEYKYLRQNIAFAMFGPPTSDKDLKTAKNIALSSDVTSIINYSKEQLKTIDMIFTKLQKYEWTVAKETFILLDIIFNVTLPHECVQEKQSDDKTIKDEKFKKDQVEGDQKQHLNPSGLRVNPIFKTTDSNCEDRYIDDNGRIYKSWDHYLKWNILPKCIMVFPKDGSYQPDFNCEITDQFSKVALVIEDSPACSVIYKVLLGADIASGVAAGVGLGIGVVSMFTPVGPIVMGASVGAMAFNSIWSIGRASENLINRSVHDESVNLDNMEAFSSWLGIAIGATGFAASTTRTMMVNALRKGGDITKLFKLVHNTALISNIVMSGAGISFQGYIMLQKYNETRTVDIVDIALFSTHVLFFGNTIMNLQFAESLIQSTQTKVMDDYRNDLRHKNLRKKYNKVIRRATAYRTDKTAQNAEVIKYINNTADLGKYEISAFPKKVNVIFKCDNLGVKKIDGVKIFDPKTFVLKFVKLYMNSNSRTYTHGDMGEYSEMSKDSSTYNNKLLELKELFMKLLDKLYESHGIPQCDRKFTVNNFIEILKDISKVPDCAKDILQQMFHIVLCVIRRSSPFLHILLDIFHLLWCYVYSNLQSNVVMQLNNANSLHLKTKVISAMSQVADMLVDEICEAFQEYIKSKHNWATN